jgi:hypothetical protein
VRSPRQRAQPPPQRFRCREHTSVVYARDVPRTCFWKNNAGTFASLRYTRTRTCTHTNAHA